MSNQDIRSPNEGTHIQPQFLRLPKPGTQCLHTGLSRSTLNELILPNEANGFKPPVRSVVHKKKYAVRGIRLINFRSLIDYLNSLPGWEPVRKKTEGENR